MPPRCCGMASKMPLRGQMVIVLIVCAVICLVIPPLLMGSISGIINLYFEQDIGLANFNRGIATLGKMLAHEEQVLVAYSVWDEMADAADLLIAGDEDGFMDFIRSEFYDFDKWSETTCGSFIAVYNKTSEDQDEVPAHLYSEYHKIDPKTLEMDIDNAAPTPSIFLGETEESINFIRELTNASKCGYIAVEDEVLCLCCQPIIHGDTGDIPHGVICRASEIHTFLEDISASAGSCVALYSLADDDPSKIPKEDKEKFEEMDLGSRGDDGKFSGDVSVGYVFTKEWKAPSWPTRMCGPAELHNDNTSTRTVIHFRLDNEFSIPGDKNHRGIGFVFDNSRELEPVQNENLVINFVVYEVFGVALFLIYGLFAEFAVLRKLDMIASAAYETLVVNNEDPYEDYYSKTPRKNKKKKKQEKRGSNEIVLMATLAAKTLEKSAADLGKKRNDVVFEKMKSSFAADQLRLLSLYCGRSDEELLPTGSKGKRRGTKSRQASSKQLRKSRSIFFQQPKQEITFTAVDLDSILNDPFSLELFKNYCVKEPLTRKLRYPARRCLLFLLGALYYRSLSDNRSIESRIECLKSIIEEFFTVAGSSEIMSGHNIGDDIGVPDSIRTSLLVRSSRCISARKPKKTLFDEACNAVRAHLNQVVFPAFKVTPQYLLAEKMIREKEALQQKIERFSKSATNSNRAWRSDNDDSSSTSSTDDPDQHEFYEIQNLSDGSELSHKTFSFISDGLVR